jgi:hypothetical protein
LAEGSPLENRLSPLEPLLADILSLGTPELLFMENFLFPSDMFAVVYRVLYSLKVTQRAKKSKPRKSLSQLIQQRLFSKEPMEQEKNH